MVGGGVSSILIRFSGGVGLCSISRLTPVNAMTASCSLAVSIVGEEIPLLFGCRLWLCDILFHRPHRTLEKLDIFKGNMVAFKVASILEA
jgi:hypothetical protein